MYNQYADDIYRFILVHVRDGEVAEDLTADTFLKAWNNIKKFDWKHERGWLYSIARNTLTDYWRKKRPLPLDETVEIIDDRPSQAEILDKEIEKERILKSIQSLPSDMKSVVTLRFMQGYSAKETAEALDLTEANVRVLQYRALKKLKGVLK